MRRFVVLEGRAAPPELEAEGEILIGRSPEADLRVFDETSSRRHARVLEADGRVVLEDLRSANGVVLNGERIACRAVLVHGDEIRIGSVRIQYRTDEAAERVTVVEARSDDRVEAAVDPDRADPSTDVGGDAVRRRMRLLCDGATLAADATDEDEVVRGLLDLAGQAFAPDRATIVLVGAGGAERVTAAAPPGASPPSSRTLRRRVLEAGEAVLVRDASDAAAVGEARSLVASRFRSTLAAPLKTAEGVLGWIALEALRPDRWGPEDLRALAAAARPAALAIRNVRALASARAEVHRLQSGASGTETTLIGEHESIVEVRQRVAKAAPVDTPVLITGPTGTGKEVVARLLHAGGPRRREPFVALNCAALVEGLLESELFGHERGAFTGATERRDGRIEQAGKGTLFLDEVGDLSAALQAKLLRVLSEGTYTRVGGRETLRLACRVLAATNRDLPGMVAAGAFRQDLFFRLAVLEIRLPPLAARGDDVVRLAEAGLERIAARLGRRVPRLAADAREAILAHGWPGNVRELWNALERAVVLLEGDTIAAADLPVGVRAPAGAEAALATGPVLTLREAQARAVKAALEAAGGRKGRAAELLGTSWPTLNRKIREYGLE